MQFIVGIDEVGRGPIAGSLCVGACAVERERLTDFWRMFGGARESKQLTPNERERWRAVLCDGEKRGVVRLALAFVGHETIDAKGMAHALRLGICRVLQKLHLEPRACRVLLDGGLKAPASFLNQETIIKGDERELTIALASIAAKVERDSRMARFAKRFPKYGFEHHKGYGTRAHYAAIAAYGPSPIHRLSFVHTHKDLPDV